MTGTRLLGSIGINIALVADVALLPGGHTTLLLPLYSHFAMLLHSVHLHSMHALLGDVSYQQSQSQA